MKIYTRNGDTGFTKLFIDNKKLETFSKADTIFDILGKIDELNVELALLRDCIPFCMELGHILIRVSGNIQANIDIDLNELVERLEGDIDDMTTTLPKLTNFIIPLASSYHAHKCRVVTREVERLLVKQKMKDSYIKFFNRLSDYFFTLARVMSEKEIIYKS